MQNKKIISKCILAVFFICILLCLYFLTRTMAVETTAGEEELGSFEQEEDENLVIEDIDSDEVQPDEVQPDQEDLEPDAEPEIELEDLEEEIEPAEEIVEGVEEKRAEITPRIGDLGNWTNYNGIVFGNAVLYDTTSGGGLAVGGNLTINNNLTIGSTYTSEYNAAFHIGEYKNEDRLPALLYGGEQIRTAAGVKELDVYGGTIAMSQPMMEWNSSQENAFRPQTDSGYETVAQEDLDSWFAHQYKIVTAKSQYLGYGNDVSISLEEFSNGSYQDYGPDYFKNQRFKVNGEVYDNALLITVRTGSDANFGQWWPVYSIINIDVNWALEYDLVVFNFPDAVNVTMNSSAFDIQNMSHWSTTVDAWIGETGMLERKALAERVVYNFPNARSVEANQTLIQGTVLAPQATFTGTGSGDAGHIYGHIIVQNYTAQGNFTIHAFHLTKWVYELVDDALREETDMGEINLRHYLYFREEATSIRTGGGEFVLINDEGNYYSGSGSFSADLEEAYMYQSSFNEDTHIQKIPYGTYILRCIRAPAGFILNTEDPEHNFTFYETQIVLDEEKEKMDVLVYSEPMLRDIYFRITDEATGQGMEGAVFVVVREADEYEDTTVGARYVSSTDGKFTSYNLPKGRYRLVEVEVPSAFGLMEGGVFYFQVDWDEETEQLVVCDMEGNLLGGSEENAVEISSDLGTAINTLTVVKYAYSETETGISYTLPGAEFDLFRQTGEGWEKTELSIITNELGYYRTDELDEGSYRLVEKRSPAGYQKGNYFADEESQEIFPDGYAAEFVFSEELKSHTVYISSEALKTDITVKTQGDMLDQTVMLTGIEFRFEHRLQNGNTWEEVLYSTVTDAEGELILSGLKAGMYRLTQLHSVTGYQPLDPAVIMFEVYFEEDETAMAEVFYNRELVGTATSPVAVHTEEGIILTVNNEAKTMDYAVYKADADYTMEQDENGNIRFIVDYLEGAEFRLRRRANIRSGWRDYGAVFTSEYQYADDGTPVLDSNGNHVTMATFEGGLLYGDYQLIEVKNPEGYETASDIEVVFEDGTAGRQIHLFTVTESMTGTGMTNTYVATDYALTYTADLRFAKSDMENQEKRLKGARFALYACELDHIHDESVYDESCWAQSTPVIAVSDENGFVNFMDLLSGDYMLVEVKAPAGYKLTAESWIVTVDAPKSEFTITTAGLGDSDYIMNGGDETAWLLVNKRKILLPYTGGAGTGLYIAAGAVLLGAAFILYRIKNKEKEE